MHFGTFFEPLDTGIEDLEKLECSLSRFAHNESAGDFNPGNID